jgi:hypothetical protein
MTTGYPASGPVLVLVLSSPMDGTPGEILGELSGSYLHLAPRELNSALRENWPLMHGPLYHYDSATLIALFKQAGYVCDRPALSAAELTVYRGEPVASTQPGISWTTDRDVAMTYARGYGTVGRVQVVRAIAPAGAVLARFSHEDEVVVEPALLRDVEVLGYLPQFKLALGM